MVIMIDCDLVGRARRRPPNFDAAAMLYILDYSDCISE